MAEYAQVSKDNRFGSNNSKGKSPRFSNEPSPTRKNTSFKEEETESQKEIAATLRELSNTVDKLSTKLDDFIENTSEVLSLGSRLPSSRQVKFIDFLSTNSSEARASWNHLFLSPDFHELWHSVMYLSLH